jgi:hypothetical protein
MLTNNNLILLGSTILPITSYLVSIISNEQIEELELPSVNPQLLNNGYTMTNTQNKKPNRHVFFNDVKVIDQNKNIIVEFPVEYMSHECIYGSNSPRYYTPDFNYDSLNTNVLCLQSKEVSNKVINPDEDIIDNIVNEYDKDGNLLWSWSPSEHFNQFELTEEEISNLQSNPIHISCFGDGHDWIHLNSACAVGENKWYDEGDTRFHPENIICCSRNLSMIFIVEKSTGNIVWKIKGSDFDFHFQHYGHVIPKGLPGAGNILLTDTYKREGRQAKIMEINPITNEVVFEYFGDFESDAMGSVQKLEDGSYFISACHSHKLLVVSVDGELKDEIHTDKFFYRVNAYPVEWVK